MQVDSGKRSREVKSKVAVVGGGVVGFSTAVCIAETLPHCSVTLLADKFSPETTSDGAAGILIVHPFPDIALERQRHWFRDSFEHLLAIAQSKDAADAGVLLTSGYTIFTDPPADKKPYWWDIVLGFRYLNERELRRFPGHTFGQAFTTIKCECNSYLPWLHKRFTKAGGKVQEKKVSSLEELRADYEVIVNCSGLGSEELAGDADLYPVRGQRETGAWNLTLGTPSTSWSAAPDWSRACVGPRFGATGLDSGRTGRTPEWRWRRPRWVAGGWCTTTATEAMA
ncbi:D-aspartate oxidase isoform X2 [Stigmatopora argus]